MMQCDIEYVACDVTSALCGGLHTGVAFFYGGMISHKNVRSQRSCRSVMLCILAKPGWQSVPLSHGHLRLHCLEVSAWKPQSAQHPHLAPHLLCHTQHWNVTQTHLLSATPNEFCFQAMIPIALIPILWSVLGRESVLAQ